MIKIIPIKTKLLLKNPLAEIFKVIKNKIKNQDILVLTSKIISLEYNGLINLNKIVFNQQALKLAKKYAISPQFAEIVINESDLILGGVKGAILTLKNGILMANAGIDASNVPLNHVAKLPKKLAKIANFIRNNLCHSLSLSELGVVIIDSVCLPLRKGTHHYALAISGFNGIIDEREKNDLFQKQMKITTHNMADEIASAAGLIMGERDQKIPAVIIRGLKVKFSNLSAKKLTKQLIISRKNDLFQDVIKI